MTVTPALARFAYRNNKDLWKISMDYNIGYWMGFIIDGKDFKIFLDFEILIIIVRAGMWSPSNPQSSNGP